MISETIARRGSWKHFLVMAVSICFLIPVAQAQDIASLNFIDLPPGSKVYIDGLPVAVDNNRVYLQAGKHNVQVETFQPAATPLESGGDQEAKLGQEPIAPTGVFVFRATVQTRPRATTNVQLHLTPVLTTNAAFAPYLGVAGSRGAPGRPGPDSNPHRKLDIEATRILLREVMAALLNDLESKAQEVVLLQHTLRETAAPPEVYWYHPQNRPAARVGIKGEVGQPGNAGAAGIPGDVFRVYDEKGNSLVEVLQKTLRLDDWRRGLAQLEQRSAQLLKTTPVNDLLAAIPTYTSEWREQLDKVFIDRGVTTIPTATFGGMRRTPQGPVGRRGHDGKWSGTDTDKIVLPQQEFERLIDDAKFDGSVTQRYWEMRERVEHLALQTEAAEKLYARRSGPLSTPQGNVLHKIETVANITEIEVHRTSGGPPGPWFSPEQALLRAPSFTDTEGYLGFYQLAAWVESSGFYNLKDYSNIGCSDCPTLVVSIVKDGKRIYRILGGLGVGRESDEIRAKFWKMETMIRGASAAAEIKRVQAEREESFRKEMEAKKR